MPPRKSNVSVVSAVEEAEGTPATPGSTNKEGAKEKKEKEKDKDKEKDREKDRDELTVEDLSLPRTMVQRLAKGVLPPNTQLQKDATTALSKSATVFISHLATAAQDHTAASNRKTMSPADVFAGLKDTEYERLIPRLERELEAYVSASQSKRDEYRRKVKERNEEKEGLGGADNAGEGEGNEKSRSGVEGGGASQGEGAGTEVDGKGNGEANAAEKLEATNGDDQRHTKRMKGEDGVALRPHEEQADEDEMLLDEAEAEEAEDGDQDAEEGPEEPEEEEEEEDDDETEPDEEVRADDVDGDPVAAQLARESRAMDPDEEASSDSD